MRDAFTNFGTIAITQAATATATAIKSANIVNVVGAGKLEASLQDLRFVFLPKAAYTGTITIEVIQSDAISSNELSSPVTTDTITISGLTANKCVIKPFLLETKKKYMQLQAFGSAGTAITIEAWLEFGAGASS